MACAFILAAVGWWRDMCGEALSRRPIAVLSRLVSGLTTGESWGMYRVDATVDMWQTEGGDWFSREDSVRGEEVGEVRGGSVKHGASPLRV
jgi:hypothetical protein